jgi:formylglycine-generating enzyme required for sulfatase activity
MLTLATMKVLGAVGAAGLSGLALSAGLLHGMEAPPAVGSFVIEQVAGATLAVARDQVTWGQWKQCYDDGGCRYLPKPGLKAGGGTFPVTGVNRFDVDEYVGWLNARTGKTYRLPTAAEWTAISHGLADRRTKKLFDDPRLSWAADYGSEQPVSAVLRPTGGFGHNAEGIADLGGNVWEWTSTCASGVADANCPAYFAEGQHEAALSALIRDPASGGCALGVPPANVGFRLVLPIDDQPQAAGTDQTPVS